MDRRGGQLARLCWLALGLFGYDPDRSLAESELPAPATRTINFRTDVQPLLETHCQRCHGDTKPKSGLNLLREDTALKGGDYGKAIIPGNSAESPLIRYVAYLEEDLEMPPIGKGERLTEGEVATLRAWIDQGPVWEAVGEEIAFHYEPTLRHTWIDGDERAFREHWRHPAGFSGGLSELSWNNRWKNGVRLDLQARSVLGAEDHRLDLELRKPDYGFIRLEYEQFRRYDTDWGGYYPPFGTAPPSLHRDLHNDFGDFRTVVGLTLPDRPEIELSYQRLTRTGETSALHWGPVQGPTPSGITHKGLFPSSRAVDETTHIVGLDVRHDWRGWRLDESFRGEFTRNDTDRRMADSAAAGAGIPESYTRVREDYRQFSGVNTFRAEKQIRSWWLLSGGYLYLDQNADAGFNLDSFLTENPGAEPFPGDTSRQIILNRHSHVFNVNSQFVPRKGLSLFTGLQHDRTRQSGEGDLWLFGTTPTEIGANIDQTATEENVGIRYTGWRRSVLYVDARLLQSRIGQRENQFVDDNFPFEDDFMRDTDAELDGREFRWGWNWSPLQRLTVQTRYRQRDRRNRYRHTRDVHLGDFTPSGDGYPAYIRSRRLDTDDFHVKFNIRVSRKLRATLAWRTIADDYELRVAPVHYDGQLFSPDKSHSGHYDSNHYLASLSGQPIRWLRLTATAGLNDVRTISSVTDGEILRPYSGQALSLLGNAQVQLDNHWEWQTTYSFSRADFSQSNTGFNFPIGRDYRLHGTVTGLSRKWGQKAAIQLQYGYYYYSDPGRNHANDYTAHALALSFRQTLP